MLYCTATTSYAFIRSATATYSEGRRQYRFNFCRDAVQRPTKARSTVLAVAAVVLAVVLGAGGTPDRKAEADRLERVINATPGVVDARVDYTNDSERGATLKLSVYLPDAPPQQIADVASRINKVGWGGGWRANQPSRDCNSKEWSTRADARMEPAKASFTAAQTF